MAICLPDFRRLMTLSSTAARRRSRRQVSVDVRFVPRLEHGWLDRLESADDVGWLSIEPDLLTFDGDRTHLEIDRRDVVGLCDEGGFECVAHWLWTGAWEPDRRFEVRPDRARRNRRLLASLGQRHDH